MPDRPPTLAEALDDLREAFRDLGREMERTRIGRVLLLMWAGLGRSSAIRWPWGRR